MTTFAMIQLNEQELETRGLQMQVDDTNGEITVTIECPMKNSKEVANAWTFLQSEYSLDDFALDELIEQAIKGMMWAKIRAASTI